MDEKIVADKTTRYLARPTAISEVLVKLRIKKVEDICWREPECSANMSARDASPFREGVWIILGSYKEQIVREGNGILEWIQEKIKDCSIHYVCKWIRKRIFLSQTLLT